MISVIIPIFNEEKILSKNASQFRELSNHTELIFVDGGSSDKSIEIAEGYGKVLRSEKGRALQMNSGAKSASFDILLFLHADSYVSQHTPIAIEENMKKSNFLGGCLTQRLAKRGAVYRFIESFGNMRARITKVFYGDQGIFIRKNMFFEMKGFPEVPIMEDVLFTKKLRKLGKTVVLPEEVSVSPRRWEKKGIIRTISFYSLLNILSWMKISSERVRLLYDDLR